MSSHRVINNFMSVFQGEAEVDSPLFPAWQIKAKPQVFHLCKLSEPSTFKPYKSTDDTSATVQLDILAQSPLRKRKVINLKRSPSKNKSKDNKSLLHSNTNLTNQVKVERKVRPQSSNCVPQLSRRKSVNPPENIYSKTPSKIVYLRPFMPPIGMTAYSYIVMENSHVHISWNSKTMVEIASLTKVMTCYCILNILKMYNLSRNEMVEAGIVETSIYGTTASLKRFYRYTIHQLLYGLMLPSGNDASLALAVWGGRTLASKGWRSSVDVTKKRAAISLFIQYMNSVGKDLELKKTKFSNPHGLSSPDNKSTAFDLSILCRKAMSEPQFRKIVGTKQFSTQVITDRGDRQEIVWKNTHKLLKKDYYLGVKTGITSTAGACLSSLISINEREFIIIVLNCKKLQRRFKETQILRKWLFKREDLCKAQKSVEIDLELEQEMEDDKEIINH